jgi:hypothetical protein
MSVKLPPVETHLLQAHMAHMSVYIYTCPLMELSLSEIPKLSNTSYKILSPSLVYT